VLSTVPQRSIETSSGILTLEDSGFVRIKNKRGVEQTLSEAKKNIEELAALMDGKRYPVLVDLEGTTLSREVRNYYGSPEVRELMTALALLVTNPVARVIANVFLAMKHEKIPTKLFTSERDALDWLRKFNGE
jgi:hypothetical protein